MRILPLAFAIALLALRSPAADSAPATSPAEKEDPVEAAVRATAEAAAKKEAARQEMRTQQKALVKLGDDPSTTADAILIAEFEKFRAGELPPGLWLELFEAAAKRKDPRLKEMVAAREQEATKHDLVSQFRECLEGGDAESGKQIFATWPQSGCIRCHKMNEEGGQIGPDLTTLHQTTERIYILESIVDPNAVITPGFQFVLLTLIDGTTISGILNSETEDVLRLTSVIDGKRGRVGASLVKERTPLPSAMPPGFGLVLGKRAVRDLVEFLATGPKDELLGKDATVQP